MVIQLTHNQSENPMFQTAWSQPFQTLHVESEQTTSVQFLKLPMQLNTLNIFVPELVRVFPITSDVQRLGRCVPALIKSAPVRDSLNVQKMKMSTGRRPIIILIVFVWLINSSLECCGLGLGLAGWVVSFFSVSPWSILTIVVRNV